MPRFRKCVCPHLRLHSSRGGVRWIKERVFAYAACCLKEREQSKKDVRGGQRERGQILHCGVGGRKGSSELGSGWKLTEKDFRLVPCGDKSPKIPACIQPENGRDETTCTAQRPFFPSFSLYFYWAWKGSLFFWKTARNSWQTVLKGRKSPNSFVIVKIELWAKKGKRKKRKRSKSCKLTLWSENNSSIFSVWLHSLVMTMCVYLKY